MAARVANRGSRELFGAYVLRPDNKPDEMILMAIFEDRQTYRANAEDPEQDRWFRRLRESVQARSGLEDGEIMAAG